MEYWYRLMQNLIVWPVSWISIHAFYKIEIQGKENFKDLKAPLLIVSNHIASLDPFLIGIVLPWGSKLLPARFMVEDKKFRTEPLETLRKFGLVRLFSFLTVKLSIDVQ